MGDFSHFDFDFIREGIFMVAEVDTWPQVKAIVSPIAQSQSLISDKLQSESLGFV